MLHSVNIWFIKGTKSTKLNCQIDGGKPFLVPFQEPYEYEEIDVIIKTLELLNTTENLNLEDQKKLINIRDEKEGPSYWNKDNENTVNDFTRRVGFRLYKSLFSGHLKVEFERLYAHVKRRKGNNTQLYVYLNFDQPSLDYARLPWELACQKIDAPTLLINNGVAIIRAMIDPDKQKDEIKFDLPIRLLTIMPRSKDLDTITTNDQEAITRNLNSKFSNSFELITLENPTFDGMKKALLDHQVDIVHFHGHGEFGRFCPQCKEIESRDTQCINCSYDLSNVQIESYLFFEDNEGKKKPVSAVDICEGIPIPKPKMFVLSACKTGSIGADAKLMSNLAPLLHWTDIPAIIAMQFSVEVEQTGKFIEYFYSSYFSGKEIEEAFADARFVLSAEERFRPVLYLSRYYAHLDFNNETSNIGSNLTSKDIKKHLKDYRCNYKKWLEEEAAGNKNELDKEDYIQNYVPLSTVNYWGPDLEDVSPKAPDNLLETLHSSERYRRVLLVGGPGSGKTSSLRRFARDLLDDEKYPTAIPIIVGLRNCGEKSVAHNVIVELQNFGSFPWLETQKDLRRLLDSTHAKFYFLFDGLNEVPPDHIDSVRKSLYTFLDEFRPYLYFVIIASRTQNAAVEGVRDKVNQTLLLQPLENEQVKAHLPQLSWDKRVSQLIRNPTILTLVKSLPSREKIGATNQSQLFTIFVDSVFKSDGRKFSEPRISQDKKWAVLKHLAYTLHQQNKVSIDYAEALNLIQRAIDLDNNTSDSLFEVVIHHGLLRTRERRQGTLTLEFAPNLMMQEYFAAEALKDKVLEELKTNKLGWFGEKRSWPTLMSKLEAIQKVPREKRFHLFLRRGQIAYLSCNPWWTETFIMLAGLLHEQDETKVYADKLLARLATSWKAPGLAYLCAIHGVGIEDKGISDLVNAIIEQQESPDLVARYEIIKEILGVIEPDYPFSSTKSIQWLLKVASDENPEIANLAKKRLGSFSPEDVQNALIGIEQENFEESTLEEHMEAAQRAFNKLILGGKNPSLIRLLISDRGRPAFLFVLTRISEEIFYFVYVCIYMTCSLIDYASKNMKWVVILLSVNIVLLIQSLMQLFGPGLVSQLLLIMAGIIFLVLVAGFFVSHNRVE